MRYAKYLNKEITNINEFIQFFGILNVDFLYGKPMGRCIHSNISQKSSTESGTQPRVENACTRQRAKGIINIGNSCYASAALQFIRKYDMRRLN